MIDPKQYAHERNEIINAYEEKYSDRNSDLITDGIVDPEQYEGILFLLKEAYGKGEKKDSWDLCQWLATGKPKKMWVHVAKWVHGLRNTTKDRVEPYVRKLTEEERREALRKIAVVNVKKVDGKSSSDKENLTGYVKENAGLLRREIELAQPRIVVCGNTFDHLMTIFGIEQERNCDNWYYWLNLGNLGMVLVLDYCHPAVRYPALLTYYGLVNCYQLALQNEAK